MTGVRRGALSLLTMALAATLAACDSGTSSSSSTTTATTSATPTAELTASGGVTGSLTAAGVNCHAGGSKPEIVIGATEGGTSYTITVTPGGVTLAPLSGKESWSTLPGKPGWSSPGGAALTGTITLDADLQQTAGGSKAVHLSGSISC
jgi:putative hemolysin